MANQISVHGAKNGFGGFSAPAHFTQPDQTIVCFNFHDGANKTAPVAAIRVAQRGLQRHRYRRGPDIADFHQSYFSVNNRNG